MGETEELPPAERLPDRALAALDPSRVAGYGHAWLGTLAQDRVAEATAIFLLNEGAGSVRERHGRMVLLGQQLTREEAVEAIDLARRRGLVEPLEHQRRPDGPAITGPEWTLTTRGHEVAMKVTRRTRSAALPLVKDAMKPVAG